MDTRQKATEEHLRKIDRDFSDLGLAYSPLNGKIKRMCCKQDRIEELMQDMNSKYESLVAMMSRLNATQNEQRNKQVEGGSSGTAISSGDLGNRNHNSNRGYGEQRNHTKLPKIDFPIFG
ncbi:Uncharacterized protein Adt_12653 [Abeliophyllum distichum]|uniref:Uncharacterized protein n=1 Tax=Abeliophyllum distichum TaxID=126358 RepID=A0ABD1URH1_9LAMI